MGQTMARIRSIKPEFWSSEQVMACSTNARLLFIGLWNFCDDAGRHPVAPRQIKALVFPGDDISSENVRGLIDELSTNGLLSLYTVDDKEYFQVTGWQHQKIDRPQSPKYPAPTPERSTNARDGRDEGGDKGKDGNEAKASSAFAPIPIDARTALFGDGLNSLARMTGKDAATLRSIVGKWVQLSGNDHGAVLATIRAAEAQGVIDPVGWISKAMRPKDPDAEIYRNVL